MNPIVEIKNVTHRFGGKPALERVNLTIAKGQVTGLIGENGAGKTTLIKHVLGLLVPDEGSVRVFGLDPVTDPVNVLAQIGYLAEQETFPLWMRVHQVQRYMRAFYPTWDQAYADKLCADFQLSRDAQIMKLSKGQKARVGLMAALAYRPELLVLDEPSSGLDPIVRRDILGAVVRLIADEGRTVLFSSHLLSEVDRVADRIAMIKQGRIVFSLGTDELKDGRHIVTLRFRAPLREAPSLEGAISWEGADCDWTALVAGGIDEVEAAASALNAASFDLRFASLEEVFVGYSKAPVSPRAEGVG